MTASQAGAPGTQGAGTGQPIDPVTFEVIRHRLWAINDDQARMAARLSGSFIVYEGYDFNAALVTADGRGLYCGVYILQHGATIDEFVRRILADWPARGDRRGRHVLHQRSVVGGAARQRRDPRDADLLARASSSPGRGSSMHDDDVGSPVPGSFVAGASDRFGEAPLFPADQDGRELRAAGTTSSASSCATAARRSSTR